MLGGIGVVNMIGGVNGGTLRSADGVGASTAAGSSALVGTKVGDAAGDSNDGALSCADGVVVATSTDGIVSSSAADCIVAATGADSSVSGSAADGSLGSASGGRGGASIGGTRDGDIGGASGGASDGGHTAVGSMAAGKRTAFAASTAFASMPVRPCSRATPSTGSARAALAILLVSGNSASSLAGGVAD